MVKSSNKRVYGTHMAVGVNELEVDEGESLEVVQTNTVTKYAQKYGQAVLLKSKKRNPKKQKAETSPGTKNKKAKK